MQGIEEEARERVKEEAEEKEAFCGLPHGWWRADNFIGLLSRD